MTSPSHRDMILDQFSRQAVPFSTAPGIMDEQALRQIIDFTGAGPEDTVLDVACGGGIIVCALAAEKKLTNVSWKQGDVLPLPYADGAFSLVISRFAFHHFLESAAVLAEMKRVCAPGGRVTVIDTEASPDAAKAAEFNQMEKLRDPSHVRAIPLTELKCLFAPAGLPAPRVSGYCLESDMESFLARSFPLPGDADKIREIFTVSLGDDRLGIPLARNGERIRYAYPVAILVADKPAA